MKKEYIKPILINMNYYSNLLIASDIDISGSGYIKPEVEPEDKW